MIDVKNRKITVVGAARSGIAAAHLLVRLGAYVKVSDNKPIKELETALGDLINNKAVTYEAGGHTRHFIEDSDLIIVSPGVPLNAAPLMWARAKSIDIISEVELASWFCPCPVIAVTGSNGKTTTVTLISAILKEAGFNVCLCGNVGDAFSNFVLDLKKKDIVVLEISSFQLQATVSFRPQVAVWTNFSQNHLDRHQDLAEYFNAKVNLFNYQTATDVAILNAQQPEHVTLAKTLKAKVDFFNGENEPPDIENPNFLAALHAVRAVGVDDKLARRVFSAFKGVEHRLEFVRQLEGVDYINDSKSTTVEAGRWALLRMSKPVVLICGGSDKKLDYGPLRDLVKLKVKQVIALGEIKHIIHDAFYPAVPVDVAVDFADSVQQARKHAKEGDCVLLSPMTASYDMFNDYEHRGRVFKELVNQL